MSADRRPPREPAPEWRELDDTLVDGPAPADVPAEARGWLAEQRLVHGLLRALHTADAAGREARVAAVLERIDRADAAGSRRHWFGVLAAALLLATFGVWMALPPALPTADAAMARAVDELSRDVDRRFHVRLTFSGRARELVRHEYDLVTRPGKRFLIDGRFAFAGVRVVDGRIGCDGETVWVDPRDARNRRSGPLAERERLLDGLGEMLDLGYLDVQSLVGRLPGAYSLRVVERTVSDDGSARLRIRARRRGPLGPLRLRTAELIVDEATGTVQRVEAEMRLPGRGTRRLEIEARGVAAPGSVDYSRPW